MAFNFLVYSFNYSNDETLYELYHNIATSVNKNKILLYQNIVKAIK